MLHRKFIAVILGAAVAITGLTTAPARAGDNDLLKVLGGVAAIAIIGSAISKKNDRDDYVGRRYTPYNHTKKTKHHVHKHHNHKGYGHKHNGNKYHSHRGYGHKHHGQKYHSHKSYGHKHPGQNHYAQQRKHHSHNAARARTDHRVRPLSARVQRKVLPRSCRVQARTGQRKFTAYSNRCLKRNFRYSNSLPGQCAINAKVVRSNSHGLVYRDRCLNLHGYTASRK